MVFACLVVCLVAASAGSLFGAVKLQILEGRPVVDGVYVNGHGPLRFLIDTATTANHLESGLARSIGLTPTYRTELTSSVGTIVARGSTGVQVVLGDVQAADQNFLFVGMEVVHQLSAGIQGILGQAFLSRFDYILDLHGKRIEFGKRDLQGRRAPFRVLNGRAAISTNLGDLVVDSGVAGLIRFGVEPDRGDSRLMRTLAGSQIVGMIYSQLIIEGRRIWSGHAVALPNQTEPGVGGLMPVSLFRSVYFCNSEGYAIFE